MAFKATNPFQFQTAFRTAVLVAATFGLTAAAVAQQPPVDQGVDPAAANEAPATAPAAPASGVVPDAQVEANVLSALAGAPSLADQPISTTTTYGTVTLTGTVKDDASKKLAAQLASTSPGVKKVVDSLEIGDIGTVAAAPDGSAPMPNAAPAPDQSAQGAPTEQGQPDQGQPQQGNQAYAQQRNPNCPPAFTPDGRPYPPPPGCETTNQPAPAPSQYYQGQAGGQQVTIPAGAHIQVRVSQGMDGKHTKVGTTFNGVLMNDVMAGGAIALPRGAAVAGVVVDAKSAGNLTGSGALALKLTSISFGGQQYPLESAIWGMNGPSKTGRTVSNTIGLGIMGALIGGAVGGGSGAAVGAVAGGTAGVASSAASPGPQAYVPSESLLNFTTAQDVSVTTVSQVELNRLATGAPGSRPRPRRVYQPYYYPYPYPY